MIISLMRATYDLEIKNKKAMNRHFSLLLFPLFFFSVNMLFAQNDFAGGEGTVDSPYQITSLQELNNVRNYLGETNMHLYFKVINEIDMSSENWNPIGNSTNGFHGNFDGGGFELTGLNIGQGANPTFQYAGLFGVAKSGATIKNVRLVGGNIKSYDAGSAYTGTIVAYADARAQVNGEDNVITIENCYSSVNINANSSFSSDIGGMVGRGHSFGGYMVIRLNFIDCIYDGNIYSSGLTNLGGIMGNNSSFDAADIEVLFSNCSNRGNLTALGESSIVGGISGNMFIENTVVTLFENCYNTGTITGGINDAYTGGIIGYGRIFGSVNFSIRNCYHYGEISASDRCVGGIAGDFIAGDTVIVNIQNCYSAGQILGTATFAGGILSRVSNINATSTFSIENCISAMTSIEYDPVYGVGNRIVSSNLGATLSGNYALNSTLLNGNTVTSTQTNSLEGSDMLWRTLCLEETYNQTLLGWDIANGSTATWTIFEGYGLPYFQRQSAPVYVSKLYRDHLTCIFKDNSEKLELYDPSDHNMLFSSTQNLSGELEMEVPLVSFRVRDEILFVNYEDQKEASYPVSKNIEKKVVVVQADSKSKCLGDPDEELTYTVEPDLIAGDLLTGNLVRQQGEEPGEYYILQGTLENDQYEIIYVRGVYIISQLNTEIIIEGSSITASERQASSYQWLDCSRQFEPIAGATQRIFTPEQEGTYAVLLTKGACTDTSNCLYFNPSSIEMDILSDILIYPNPVYDQLVIDVKENSCSNMMIKIFSSEGKMIEQLHRKNQSIVTIPFSYPYGVYFIHIAIDEKDVLVRKIVK